MLSQCLARGRETCHYHPTPARSDKAEWGSLAGLQHPRLFFAASSIETVDGTGRAVTCDGAHTQGTGLAGICMLRDSGDDVHVKVHAPGGRALVLAARDGGAVLVALYS